MNYELRMKSMLLTGVCLWLSLTATAATANRTITKAEAVSVEVPVGHAPRLPYRVWVHYSDGRGEYRQVKWQNSSLVREQAEADPTINPAGTEYKVKGFVTGDNTTANGYPVTALVKVTAKEWEVPSNRAVAETLPLDKVAISGNNRLTWNRNMDIDHLLTLDVRQQLYNYRDTYGLPTEGYPEADGWDSPTTKLKGHGSGHYMSAMAFAFACAVVSAPEAPFFSLLITQILPFMLCNHIAWHQSDAVTSPKLITSPCQTGKPFPGGIS